MKSLAASVRKLIANMERASVIPCGTTTAKRTWNSGNKVEVDYFALLDLIRYYEETRDQANRVMIARDMLENVYFGRHPENVLSTVKWVAEQ